MGEISLGEMGLGEMRQNPNFVCIFTGSIGLSEQKSIKNVGKSSCGRRQGLSKIFRAAIYRAHRAVVFAIAQLSCSEWAKLLKTRSL